MILDYISIFLLTIISVLYISNIILEFKLGKKIKEIFVVISYILIGVSILFIKPMDYEFHKILIYALGFILTTVIYKEIITGNRNIFKYHKDIVYFFISLLVIFTIFALNKLGIGISRELLIFSIFIFYLLTLGFFLYGFCYQYQFYPYKIGLKTNLLLLLYLLIYLSLLIDLSIHNNFQVDFNLSFIAYSLFTLIGIIKLFTSEITVVEQLLDLKKTRTSEFKILEIIESLVLQSEEYDSTLGNVLRMACELTNSDGGVIYLYDKATNEFHAKKINGFVIPPFFVNVKLLEDRDAVDMKIMNTKIDKNSVFFNKLKESKELLQIRSEPLDESRVYLNDLREYANNIDSMLGGKIIIDESLYGVIILQMSFSNYNLSDLEVFKAICSIVGVLIKNIESKAMAKEKERLTNEMKIAEQIQTGILPKNLEVPGYDIAAFMRPATEVGGDYYDLITAPDGKTFWVNIGDVTGHGVTAGLIMMMLQTSSMTAINTLPNISPRDLAIYCNKILYHNIRDRLLLDQFITSCFFKFKENGNFEFAGAHEDVFIYRHATGYVEILKTSGIWLGLMEDISHRTVVKTFNLYPNDTLLLYTDGVIEIQNSTREQYDVKRLRKFLEKNGERKPEEISKLLIKELEDFKAEQLDDITYVILKKNNFF